MTGLSCNYSTAGVTNFCDCTYLGGPILIDGGNQAQWECSNNAQSGCPTARPHLGASCTRPDLTCDYSVCGEPTGLAVQCDGTTGTWTQGMAGFCASEN
jgi:hypothetical protein